MYFHVPILITNSTMTMTNVINFLISYLYSLSRFPGALKKKLYVLPSYLNLRKLKYDLLIYILTFTITVNKTVKLKLVASRMEGVNRIEYQTKRPNLIEMSPSSTQLSQV